MSKLIRQDENARKHDDMVDARKKTQAWNDDYNESPPHGALNKLASRQFQANSYKRRSKNR